ncbi:dynein regulator [Hysterangium stoloniferum]|nr:dynein regulator [Hysterangium stoloniferum]
MSGALSERQQEDLHRSILDYLSNAGFTKTYEQMKDEVPGLTDFEPDPTAKTAGLLVKKWTGLIRLQRKIMDLEARLSQAQEDLSHLSHLPPGTSKRANLDWLPRAPPKHTLTGHRDAVTAVSFHPLFSSIVSASADATLKVWDWDTGELERTLKGHTKHVSDCEYDSKGKNLVSCSHDLFVKLWNVENDYQNFATLRGHEHSVSSATFLPGDDRVISASRDQTVRIWSVATTHCIKVVNAHLSWIRRVFPSPDGRLLLTCSDDHASFNNFLTARVSDIESGTMKTEMRGHENIVLTAVFAPSICLPAIRELVARPANSLTAKIDALGVAFVLTGSRDKTIKLWDALSGQCLWTFIGHDNWIHSLAFHPSGKYLLSASDDKTVRIWDLKTGRCAKKIEAHDQFIASVKWGRQVTAASDSKDESVGRPVNVMATCSWDKTVKIWLP